MKPVVLCVLLVMGWQGLLAQSGLPRPVFDPVPGVYTAAVKLNVKPPDGASMRYRFLESSSTQTFAWTDALLLEALPGESRTFTLRLTTDFLSGETETKDYIYKIAPPVLPVATVQPVPGEFTSAVTVRAALPAGWSASIGGRPVTFPLTLDAPSGDSRTFFIQAQGPRGRTQVWSYTIDKRDQESTELEVLSPLPGTWANAQPLVVEFKGVDQVQWSYGAHLDPGSAHVYQSPIVLDATGDQKLTVAARSRKSGLWMEKSVSWTAGSGVPPVGGWPVSGVVGAGLHFPPLPDWQVSWDEGRSWQPLTSSAAVESSSTVRKVLTVQLKKEGLVARYAYWLDSRPPKNPEVQFLGGWNPEVVFSGSVEALHRVIWTLADGRLQIDPLSLWGPTGAWKVPDQTVGARVEVVGINGLSGPPSTIAFAQTGWSTPDWEPWDQTGAKAGSGLLPVGGRVIARSGFWPVYEASSQQEVREPDSTSPDLEGAFLPSVPFGADRTFFVRFAWRDAAGLVGPASQVFSVRVDRIPPQVPEVSVVGGKVVVRAAEGEKDGTSLYWAFSQDRVATADSLSFQPYDVPLDAASLQTGSAKTVWLHALARDRSGNSGPPRLNVALTSEPSDKGGQVVRVDPDPAVGDQVVEPDGIYPWSDFRLRFVNSSRDLWAAVWEGSALPANWRTLLQPLSGTVSGSVRPGERRTFLLLWNLKVPNGWTWAAPKSLTFVVDRGPPSTPVLSNPWPQTPLVSWTPGVLPGRAGDNLRFSFSVDGSQPPDPVVAGEPWTGTRTWEAAPGQRLAVRLRIASVSVSGLSAELPAQEPVILDGSTPPPVVPALAPFSYKTDSVLVTVPPGTGLVRYSLSDDGTSPDLPTAASKPVPPLGMLLEGKPGQSVLYRFRWRPFSPSGFPGPATDPYAVLVDRTQVVAAAPGVSAGSPLSLPVPEGLPTTGVSAQPVTLRAQWKLGILRYEVREGVGSPRSVTADSPALDRPLTLDGGAGFDHSFVVSLRGFSPDGRPLTAEKQYAVRVDRSSPEAPGFDLVADPRRPEVVVKNRASVQSSDQAVYYRWLWKSFPEGQGEGEWTLMGANAPRFAAPGGALTLLKVEAYVKDEAGNQSPVTQQSVIVDQNVVYAASQGDGDGSRLHPLGSVTAAVDKMRHDGKSILFLGAGSFAVNKTLDFEGFQVYGGWNPSAWENTQDPARSQLVASAPFSGSSFVESGDRAWGLFRVDLTAMTVPLQNFAFVRGARVEVKDSAWSLGRAEVAWDQVGGSLTGTNLSVSYAAQPKGNLLLLKTVKATFSGLAVAVTQNHDGVLMDFTDCEGLFQNLTVSAKKSLGFSGVWAASGSRLTIDGATIEAGEGADRVSAFVFKTTDATFWNTNISLYGSVSNTGFQASGGRLEVQKSSLSLLRGEEFNQGVVLDHGTAVFRTTNFKVAAGAYQGGFTVDGGTLSLASGEVELAGGGQQCWGAQFQGLCTVTVEDVNWVLLNKTVGELWKLEQPWTPESKVVRSTTSGW